MAIYRWQNALLLHGVLNSPKIAVTIGEGPKPIFQCKNIKDNGYLYRENCCSAPSSCTINLVMLSAEEKMRDELRSKTLSWLNEELDRVLSKQIREDTLKYFSKSNT